MGVVMKSMLVWHVLVRTLTVSVEDRGSGVKASSSGFTVVVVIPEGGDDVVDRSSGAGSARGVPQTSQASASGFWLRKVHAPHGHTAVERNESTL